MTTSSAVSPKVFISYTHDSPEHMDRVLELGNRLRIEGIDCQLDQYEMSPTEGWPRWTERQIEEADFVLVVCTETYLRRFKGTEEAGKGLGAQWEGAIITQALYDDAGDNKKFIPVLLSPEESGNVPHVLRGVQSYNLDDADSEGEYTELYRRLTNQPRVAKPELGSPRPLPTRERKQFFLTSSWNIPYTPNPFFTGREDALAQLHEALNTKGTAAVSGMPGVGKTQTAVEYAHRHRSEYKLILWARAEARETLISDYVNIADILQLPEVRAQEQNLAVGAVKRWFDANPDWLLILDNADDLTLVREFLPATPKGRTILTTRAQATGAIATNIEVLKMEEYEGALFLLRRAKILAEDLTLESAAVEDRNKAIEITKEVDGLPLALDQAGAFIEESSSSPAEYLYLYRTQGADLRKRRGEHVLGHPESVEITFSLSFNKVEAASPTTADLLRACAFLAPDLIPEEIFTEGGTHLGDLLAATVNNHLSFIDTVKETLRYSLLRRDPDARTLSIHRVVQDVLKDNMDEDGQRQWTKRVVKAVNQVLPEFDETDYSEWYRFERLIPHTQVCNGLIETRDFKFPEAAQLLNNAGRYMQDRARLTEAEPIYVRALAIREYLYGTDNLDVAASLHNLGWLKEDTGKYSEAEFLYLQSLAIRKLKLGEHDIMVAQSMRRLGEIKLYQGKYSEAKTYFNQALESLKTESASNDSILSECLIGLANTFLFLGKYADAESVLLNSLEIREKIYGTEHLRMSDVHQLLGRIYNYQKKFLKAEACLLRARKIVESIYGTNHPSLSDILDELAASYREQNKLLEAQAHSLQALEIVEKVYSQEHPEVARKLNHLAIIYKRCGDCAKAEDLTRRALGIQELTLDSNNPNVAITLSNLATLYSNSRRYSEADSLFRKALAIQKKAFTPEHPTLLNTQASYAELLQRMNRKGEAQKLSDYVRKMRSKKGRKRPKR
jgi:tetratricopeptide (TPR) repeat protein